MPFGYDQLIHRKNKNKIKNYDISFVGTADQKRFDIINKLSNYKVIVGGDGWNKYNLSKNIKYIGNVNPVNFSKIISQSKISLNILREQNYKSHNMKTFEITSMGGLMLTKRTVEQNNFFPENFSCFMYDNSNELLNKIKKILNNYNKLVKVSSVSYKMSKKHSYHRRAKFILEKVFDEKNTNF